MRCYVIIVTLLMTGQPKTCLLFADGMTVVKGDTPRRGIRQSKAETSASHITSRIIGVEVHCGPIHGTMLYIMDNLVGGGANILIEVIRQSILDVQSMLHEINDKAGNPMDMPQHLILQFDNCGENKNKFVFAYVSLLVENRQFEVVEMFFLIVGHTHASIDQFFSVLSKAIFRCHFIASPLSLVAKLMSVLESKEISLTGERVAGNKSKEGRGPLLVKQIVVVYDMKAALQPLLNKNIHFFQIPHKFRFELYQNTVCTMQYSIFSTHPTMLPIRPDNVPNLDLEESLSCDVRLFSVVGGEEAFFKSCGVAEPLGAFSLLGRQSKTLEVM